MILFTWIKFSGKGHCLWWVCFKESKSKFQRDQVQNKIKQNERKEKKRKETRPALLSLPLPTVGFCDYVHLLYLSQFSLLSAADSVSSHVCVCYATLAISPLPFLFSLLFYLMLLTLIITLWSASTSFHAHRLILKCDHLKNFKSLPIFKSLQCFFFFPSLL